MSTKSIDTIKGSKAKQQAVLGHALLDPGFYEQCSRWGVAARWFNLDVNLGTIWNALSGFVAKTNRHPTLKEILTMADNGMGSEYTERFNRDVKTAVGVSRQIGADILIEDLRTWAAGTMIIEAFADTSPFMQAFNVDDNIPAAIDVLQRVGQELSAIIEVGQTTNCFISAQDRIRGERDARRVDSENMIDYGIPYLDDCLGGIMPEDVILIGSKSGMGKTQLVSNIAAHQSENGKKVYFFALEAEDREIERRIKFSFMARKYFAESGDPGKRISYKDWRQFKLESELGPYEDEAEAYFEQLKNLKTFYRNRGDFNIDTLEKEVTKIAKEADLIILDHIHFIDIESAANENAEMKKIVKMLNDLVSRYKVPIIIVAHLRKTFQGKNHALVPNLEDFHGSSDLVKIVKNAIILAPARGLLRKEADGTATEKDKKLYDTYVQIRKSRIAGGPATTTTGVMFFDVTTNSYWPKYAVGELTSNDSKWEPLDYRPDWAKNGTVTNIIGSAE